MTRPPRPVNLTNPAPIETPRSSLPECACADDFAMRVRLIDGREVGIPLAWFPKLQHATPAQRKRWRLIGEGVGIPWDAIDEDLSVAALLSH